MAGTCSREGVNTCPITLISSIGSIDAGPVRLNMPRVVVWSGLVLHVANSIRAFQLGSDALLFLYLLSVAIAIAGTRARSEGAIRRSVAVKLQL